MLPTDQACLQRAWPIICQLIALLQVQTRTLCKEAPQRWRLLHLSRVAESLLRRWLVLKASEETHLQLQPPQTPAKARVGGDRMSMTAQPTPFTLYEPERALAWLDPAPAAGHSLPQTGFCPGNLQDRIAALCAVIADPEPHVQRMAKWLARAAARRKTGPGRAHPLRVSWPPGSSRRQRRQDPERQGMLAWLDDRAREAVARMGGP